MAQFHVTYDVITPESAEQGDVAERGFIDSRGWHVELPDGVCGEPAGAIKDACGMTLREALNYVSGVWRMAGLTTTMVVRNGARCILANQLRRLVRLALRD